MLQIPLDGVITILGLIGAYLIFLNLKVKEILAEVKSSQEKVDELLKEKVRLLIKLKASIEKEGLNYLLPLFKNIEKLTEELVSLNVDEKIIKDEEINEELIRIAKETEGNKDLLVLESYRETLQEIENLNTKIKIAVKNYLKMREEFNKLKRSFPFSIFPWPKWKEYKKI